MQPMQPTVRRFAASLQVLALTLFLFTVCAVRAQIAGTGNIQGTVEDSTGAVIAGAEVTITEEATQVARMAKTDNRGLYIFPNINIGTYTVSVTTNGFKTFSQTHNVLEVGSNITINVKLAVGAATEKVEVASEALALQTEDASFKQTIDEQDITEMPLNSNARQITDLVKYSGGANTAPSGDFTGNKYTYQAVSVSIAGGAGNTTLWRLDGGDNNDYMGNANLPFPFPDAVAQFSVESTALGAQDGMHSGGMVNAVTRSGTNTIHGSAFEFIRNDIIDATNFFSNAPDQLHQNEFGGTIGGPILKNRLFLFAGYQRLISRQLQSNTQRTVPTAANLNGDFSLTDGAGCTSSKKTIALVDPLTGAPIPGDKYATQPTYNAQALALQKYLPVPNAAGDPNGCGFVFFAIPDDLYDNEFVTRADYTLNANNHLYGRYFLDGFQQPAYYSPTNILITTASGNVERTQSLTLGEDFTISSQMVNSAHVTVLRRSNNRGYNASDINAGTLGVTAYQAEPNGLQLTTGKFVIGGGTNSVSHFNDNTLAFDDDVTFVRGKHQMVFGGEFVRNQLNISNAYESNGNFAFNGQYSGSGPNGGKVIGDQNLDFLWGAMSSFQQSKFQQNALRGNIPSLYFQDTYHANTNLTLVAGVRWSPEYMPTDYFNRGTTFSMSGFLNNQISGVYPNAPAGTAFYGDPGVPKGFTQNSPWQFSPNVGIAWDPVGDGKTVVRAGAELIYDEVNFFTGQRAQQNPPFATAISETQTATSGPLSFSSPWSNGSLTTNPFPQPFIPTPATAQFFPQSQYIVLPTQFKASRTMQWTMSVQHQFGHGWQMQLDYIGNKTSHGPLGLPLSPATYVPGVWGAGGTGCPGVVTTGPAGAVGAAGSPCSTTSNQNQRYFLTEQNPLQGNQYAGGGGGSVLVGDEGSSNYNGLVTTVQHRLSSSFSLLTNWTWSKCLNIEDAQGDIATTTVENPNNPAMDYGPCGSDYRHVENVVLIAKSNFHLSRYKSLVLNGWEFAPLAHITSGAPFTVTDGVDISLTAVGNDRPNLVPGVPIYLHQQILNVKGETTRGYLNPAAFCSTSSTTNPCPNPVASGTYGNLGRNTLRGPSQYQFDAQVSRIFPVYQRMTMTARLECFNVLNHPNFSNPTSNLSSSTFGQISGASPARVFQGSMKFIF